jgi:hypothetical protein
MGMSFGRGMLLGMGMVPQPLKKSARIVSIRQKKGTLCTRLQRRIVLLVVYILGDELLYLLEVFQDEPRLSQSERKWIFIIFVSF